MGNPLQASSIAVGLAPSYIIGPGIAPANAENPGSIAALDTSKYLQVAAINPVDNAIWTTAQGGAWSNWQKVGGSCSKLERLHTPQGIAFAIATSSGNVELADFYSNSITSLGGQVGNPNFVVGQIYGGGLEVFVIGTDNAIWHKWVLSGNWSGWESLGGGASNIDVGMNFLRGLEVFVIGSNNNIWHIWQGAPKSNWSNWDNLGGGAVNLTLGTNFMNGLEVFIIGTDNAIWHKWQDSHGNWSGWESLGGQAGQTKQLAVGRISAYPGLEVFIIGTDNAVWHKWQDRSYNWSGWESLGGGVKDLAVATNAYNGLEVFVIGTDNIVYHNWQIQSLGNWSGWQALVGGS